MKIKEIKYRELNIDDLSNYIKALQEIESEISR